VIGREYVARVEQSSRTDANVAGAREVWARDDLRTAGTASRADLRLGLTSGAGRLTRRRRRHLELVDHTRDASHALGFLLCLSLHLGIEHLSGQGHDAVSHIEVHSAFL
jgi:hypothetical protein